MKLTINQWFKERAKWKIQPLEIEGHKFEVMMLSDKQIDEVKLCHSYDAMLKLAANYGLSIDNNRTIDNEEHTKNINILWDHEDLKVDSGQCIQLRVGEQVCEISGLGDVLLERLEADKQAAIAIDGDNLGDTDITLEQLAEDAAVAAAA